MLHVGLETRRSAVAARLQTAAFAWRCGSLHAGLARPWNATVGEPGQRAGTGCLLSPQTSRLSKRLRPQHPSAAIRNAPVIDCHAVPPSPPKESSRAPRADERFARKAVARGSPGRTIAKATIQHSDGAGASLRFATKGTLCPESAERVGSIEERHG